MNQHYSDQERALAFDIANALDDLQSLEYHLQNAHMFTEAFQRGYLQHVLSIPEHKIKKSRAALYTYLMSKHRSHGNTRH